MMHLALRASDRPDYRRVAVMVALGSLLALVVLRAVSYALQPEAVAALLTNADHRIYMDAADRIREGGPLYPAWQLAGPYSVFDLPELYPPTTMYLLVVPMSFLPDVLWWAVPLGIVGWIVAHWRPSPIGWIVILLCLAPPFAWNRVLAGGLVMYVAAFVALGTRWPAFYAGAFLKPSLFPFALIGVRSRWWWAAVAAGGAVSLALLPAWLDYLTVLRNLTDGGGLLYSLHDLPIVLIPIVAKVTSARVSRT